MYLCHYKKNWERNVYHTGVLVCTFHEVSLDRMGNATHIMRNNGMHVPVERKEGFNKLMEEVVSDARRLLYGKN